MILTGLGFLDRRTGFAGLTGEVDGFLDLKLTNLILKTF